ncbi:MAG: hypothetical protein NE328_21900 [Lentisphaeraceae bacterium]|nr:hypothetical protein [Lentisphaeraceae bacterium]
MKQIIFTAFTAFLALWLEVSLAHFGLIVPLVMFQAFYVTVVRKWRWGIITSLVICAPLDNLLGYTSLPAVLVVIIIASFWRSIGDCSRAELQVFPVGFGIGCGVLALYIIILLQYDGYIQWFQWSMQYIGAVLIVAFTSPFIIRFQDLLADKLELSTYSHIQKEELYSASDK